MYLSLSRQVTFSLAVCLESFSLSIYLSIFISLSLFIHLSVVYMPRSTGAYVCISASLPLHPVEVESALFPCCSTLLASFQSQFFFRFVCRLSVLSLFVLRQKVLFFFFLLKRVYTRLRRRQRALHELLQRG